MNFIPQHDQMDCGPACIAMIAKYFKRKYPLGYLRENCFLGKDGVSLLGISIAAKKIGFETFSAKLNSQELSKKENLPCILHWNQNHFVVLYDIQKDFFSKKIIYKIADPGYGLIKLKREQFEKSWLSDGDLGVALFMKPTQKFYELIPPKENKISFQFILNYLKPYKTELFQLFIGLLGGSLLTLLFPFLTQALIDKGIGNNSIRIIYIILLAQVFLFLGNSAIEIIRNWITLYIGARINITIISDFLKKLMSLPIKFFDAKMMGDFTQRIGDHERIEKFLTSQSLFTLFSLINVSVFFLVLAYYDFKILTVYFILTILAVGWILFFLKKRKFLDYQSFQKRAENQDSIYELINGMQEIKLNGFEKHKRNAWEAIQVQLFNINQRILRLDQYQGVGFNFINHFKNIIVTFIAANEVIKGDLTLGAMLSISYIIGQMNSPINQLTNFFRSFQDARLSLDRLSEIHQQEEEENDGLDNINEKVIGSDFQKNTQGLKIVNMNFGYEGPKFPLILNEINLFIPEGQITAVVGASGSGKTTLMKILLKFYSPHSGDIYVNKQPLGNVSSKSWRKHCGTVMQDGFIFSDTIERNIATSEKNIDEIKLWKAIETANLQDFVTALPLGVKTKIGASGNGISGGQKQRILIARAVYKNPKYLFFDEATSALDAENERTIMNKLNTFLKGKTSVIIAHRLSTVKNAHQIIVLKNGRIVERGNHSSLVANRGDYFHLVKNQLELGE